MHKNLRILGGAIGISVLSMCTIGCYKSSCEDTGTCGPYYEPPPGYCVNLDAPEGERLYLCDAGAGADAGTDASVTGDAGGADGDGLDVDGALSDSSLPSDSGDEPKPEAAPPCDKGAAPGDAACVIDHAVGGFVSPKGDDTAGLGTKAAPYKTLAKAIADAKAKTKRVYACDDGTGYPESITIGTSLDGIVAYGGFACGAWTYSATAKAVVKPASGTALKVSALTTGLTLDSFEFDSADATTAGGSSIAVIVDTAQNVAFNNVKVVAGKGGDGAPGVDGTNGDDGAVVGTDQQGKDATCTNPPDPLGGGKWLPAGSACGSRGGNGGPANLGTLGSPGLPGTPGTPNGGAVAADGGPGANGLSGSNGTAAPQNAVWSAAGYAPSGSGGNGAAGQPGQGGGGGGATNAGSSSCIGASGGAGGMGACGGVGGTGGASAGASVALFSWRSGVTLTGCTLVSAAGGAGGKGGNGGTGGTGKDGAQGGSMGLGAFAGHGGKGGNGGAGGPGAGGNGGPSYAMVYNGTEPVQTTTTLSAGSGGAKGAGGTAGPVLAPDGTAGTAQQKLQAP
jgi:hypothetical protein